MSPGTSRAAVYLVVLAVAQHGGAAGQHGAYRIKCFFRLAFLNESDEGIDENDTGNDASIHIILESERDSPGDQQHIDQWVVKLQQKAQPGSASLGRGQAVMAILLDPLGSLLPAQPRVGVNGQGLQGLCCGLVCARQACDRSLKKYLAL